MRSTRSPSSATPSPPLPTSASTSDSAVADAAAGAIEAAARAAGPASAAEGAAAMGRIDSVLIVLAPHGDEWLGGRDRLRVRQLSDAMEDHARADVHACFVATRAVGHALF